MSSVDSKNSVPVKMLKIALRRSNLKSLWPRPTRSRPKPISEVSMARKVKAITILKIITTLSVTQFIIPETVKNSPCKLLDHHHTLHPIFVRCFYENVWSPLLSQFRVSLFLSCLSQIQMM